MTVEEMQAKGYSLTKKEVTALNKKILLEYKKSLDEIRDYISVVYSDILDGVDKNDWFFEMQKGDNLKKVKTELKKKYSKLDDKTMKTLIDGSELSFNNNYMRQQFSLGWMQKSPIFKDVNENQMIASVLGSLDNDKIVALIDKKSIWSMANSQRIADEFGVSLNTVLKSELEFVKANPNKVLNIDTLRNAVKNDISANSIYLPKYGNIVETMKVNQAATIAKLDSIMNQAILQGNGAKEVGKQIKSLLGTSASKAMLISRTEMMRNMNAGSYSAYQETISNGVDVKRMLVATLDMKTRDQSGSMDSQIADVNGLFLYPNGTRAVPGNTGNPAYDCNDRETVVDIIEGFEPGTRSGRNPVTGQTELMNYKSFDTWMVDNNLTRTKSGKIV